MPDGGHWELQTAGDLFRKAERDLKRFDAKPNAYVLFDLLVTLNHIWDWVQNDDTIPRDVKSNAPSQATHREIKLVLELCNRAKHFKRGNAPDTTHVRSGTLGTVGAQLPFVLGGVPMYLVNDGGDFRDVREVAFSALTTWKTFLNESRLI